jgi:MFS family permease
MTPASLAIIEAAFQPSDRTHAIGTWAGFSGVSAAIAPFLGGWLLEAGSWRPIFLINVPVAAAVAARQAAAPLPPMLRHRAAPDRPCPSPDLRRSLTA